MDYRTGDTIFFKTDHSIMSTVIQWLSNGEYTHCGIIVMNQVGKILVLESEFLKNRAYTPLENFNREYTILPTNHLFNDSVLYETGFQPYGYIDIILFGLSLLLGKIGITIKPKDYIGEICTDFVCRCLNLPLEKLTPSQLYNRLKS